MALSEKDREDFLNRLGAVRKVRAIGSKGPDVYVTDSGKEWDDDDIEMAINLGF
jgi:hypothetical protein